MFARESGNLIEATNQVSVLELALRLVAEWRIVLAGTFLGLLVSTVIYFVSQPVYTCNMMILIGHKYGHYSPTPLETPFLAARRIALRFGGASGETIKTKIYEDDFDLRKRFTLEISVTTGSPEQSLALAWRIINFLREEHERLYQEAMAANPTDADHVVPTTIPLKPDRAAIIASAPGPQIFLSGIFAGLFFGVIGAALIQAWRRTGAEIV